MTTKKKKKPKRSFRRTGGKDGVLFLRNMDPGIKGAFKAWCAARGKSMSVVIEKFMARTVQDEVEHEVHRPAKASGG
jgi:hypothetical protein